MPGLSFRRPGDAVFRPAVAVQVHGGRPHQYGQRLIGPGDGDLQATTRCGAAVAIRTGALGVDGMELHADDKLGRQAVVEQQLADRSKAEAEALCVPYGGEVAVERTGDLWGG